jgi:hypothetical protein
MIIVIFIIVTRVYSGFIVREAASLPRCQLGHHQTNPWHAAPLSCQQLCADSACVHGVSVDRLV